MVRNKVQYLAHPVRLQLADPRVIIRPRTDPRVQLIMISNVVPVQTLRAGLKIRRGVYIAYSQRVQICDDLERVDKREPPIELQPVRAGGDAWMLFFHSTKKTSNVQRRNAESAVGIRRSTLDTFLHAFGNFNAEKI